jgi:hypothetical protein
MPLPALIVIDGGKGQLNAAHAEMARLGLGHVPIIEPEPVSVMAAVTDGPTGDRDVQVTLTACTASI